MKVFKKTQQTDKHGLPFYVNLSTGSTKTALEIMPELLVYSKDELPDEIHEY
jgi:hypothetical protein